MRIICSSLVLVVTVCFCLGVAAVATTQGVHKDCTNCHGNDEEKTAVKKRINETCSTCHPGSKGRDHRVGIVSNVTDHKLPLGEGGIITCATCHEPHGKTKEQALLRMSFNDLCKSCHNK
jgi:predicted CXXCH cytochrome family protein